METHDIERVVELTLIKLGLLAPYVSQAQAIRMFGRSKVQKWYKERWIDYLRDEDNGGIRILRSQLDEVATRNNVLIKYMLPEKKSQVKKFNNKA